MELKSTPVKNWPANDLLAFCRDAARKWWKEPAFNSGGALDDIDDRAHELLRRILENLHKSDETASDQITQFYRLANYCKPGMIESCYTVPTLEIRQDESDDAEPEPLEPVFQDDQSSENLDDLLNAMGIEEYDYTLFQSENRDWAAATGLSERDLRILRDQRRKQIINKVLRDKTTLQKLCDRFPKLRVEFTTSRSAHHPWAPAGLPAASR